MRSVCGKLFMQHVETVYIETLTEYKMILYNVFTDYFRRHAEAVYMHSWV